MTRWLIPLLRRGVQLASLAVLVLMPLFALYTHYKEARALNDLPASQWQTKALQSIDNFVKESESRQRWVVETQGTFWSARLVGVSITDPLAGAEAIFSSRSFYAPLLWSLAIPLLATALLGRVFCGWICPMNTFLEVVDRGRRLLKMAEIRERDIKFSLWNKYVVLGLALAFAGVVGVPFLALIYPPAVISREFHLYVFGGGVGVGIYLMFVIAAFELFVSKRWWCRYACPGGALYSLIGRFRLVRIRRDEQKCVQCGDCVKACQFDLRPMLVETTGMECTNCASCIRACDSDALHYKLVLPLPILSSKNGDVGNSSGGDTNEPTSPSASSASDSDRDSRPAAHSASALAVMLAIAAGALAAMPATARAHHILGLPHYSYKENYPQAPTLEYPADTGPYRVLMTSYPGKPIPGEKAMIAFYIKNKQTGVVYKTPVTARVLKTATFGGNQVIYEPATHRNFDNQFKFAVTFPDDGEYIIELTMQVEGQQEVIPFLMVAGDPSATASFVVAISAGLLVFLVVVRAIKIKRDRHDSRLASAPAAAPENGLEPHAT